MRRQLRLLVRSLAGLAAWASIWVYLVACLLGGALAGVVFQLLNPDDA